MDELVAERVLRVAEAVPPGRVVSYGDIADALGIGPRQVGHVMATWGSAVPWWRVTNHAGDLSRHLRAEGFEHWAEEGIRVKPNGLGCRIAEYRWPIDPAVVAAVERLQWSPGGDPA